MKRLAVAFAGIWLILGSPPASVPAAELQLGVTGHPFQQEGYRDVPVATQLQWVQRLGAGWYRSDWGSWAGEPEGLARLDTLVDEADRRQIKLLPILFPPVDLDREDDQSRIYKTSFEFASRVVEHFKGSIRHWELHNELDLFAMIRKGERMIDGTIWQWGDPDGSHVKHYHEDRYRRARALLRGLADGVRSADPEAVRMINTGGWLHTGFIKRLHDDRAPFDVLAWHWYSEMGDITRVRGDFDLLADLTRFGRPIWITEWNRRNGSIGAKGESEQAEYLQQTLLQFRDLADRYRLEAVFVYELFDEPYFGPDNGESHYGLIRLRRDALGRWTPGEPKRAFDVLRNSPAR